METTFISIHDLSDRATILYSSDSVIDILGYTPDDIVNHSVWEFFPEDELPLARKFHQKRVAGDKAAVLAYVRVRDKNGQWIGCECCFTIVYDVMVVCTSIYQRGTKSEKRALEAPMVRRIFSSSPKDPRYHMLTHLSAKFSQPVQKQVHEPRAALFVNRFTRTLTIMYATSGLNEVIGIPAETMRGRSFYYCIAENCLHDAVKCLENAKGNDSIAYMRFWFRDPRTDDQPAESEESSEEEMTTDISEDGGVHLQSVEGATNVPVPRPASSMDVDSDGSKADSRHSSGDSTRANDTHEAIFGQPPGAESSTSSLAPSPQRARNSPGAVVPEPIELEAVISCTSDGLVVCLRRARPMIPHPAERPALPVHQNGLFAAPWAHEPILPPRAGTGYASAFAPALGPQGVRRDSPTAAVGGPDQMDFMNSIRDQAIFAWALTGINGCLADYGHGKPSGESLPLDGLPIWSESQIKGDVNPANLPDGLGAAARKQQDGSRGPHIFGDPGLSNNGSRGMGSNSSSSSGTPYPPGPGQQ